VALHSGIDGSDPVRRIDEAGQRELRPARTSRMGTGTLACPRCDAPVALAGRIVSPADRLACPFCAHAGRARDFLSLATPTRPARVTLRVVERASWPPAAPRAPDG
jgi:hypothetical protein